MGWKPFRVHACVLVALAGCAAGETRIDPADLELRDLLGVSTDVATKWDADQRASARHVLVGGLATRGETVSIVLDPGRSIDDRVAHAITVTDKARHANGADALALVRVTIAGDRAIASAPGGDATIGALTGAPSAARIDYAISDRWPDDLPGRGLDLLSAIAADAGHTKGSLVISPAPRLPAIASYVDGATPARLLVNPVVLAALEPLDGVVVAPVAVDPAQLAHAPVAPSKRTDDPHRPVVPDSVAHAGNPYSFYGSVNECASAQRTRCESCLGSGGCEAITAGTDGATECNALAANNGRGYFLICINLALAITSVNTCSANAAPGCARDTNAASELNELENNAVFLDDGTCGSALDGCLADIFGAPPDAFPGLDGGIAPPRPPRETSVSCTDSCDSKSSNNCDATGPSCGSGPSCGNSLSCDGACSSSNDQQGCGGNCNACTADSGGTGGSDNCGGSDGGGGGSCGGDSSGGSGCGGGDSGGSCGGGDSGGSCGSDSGGGGCGGSSGGGGCGGSSSSSGGCSGGGGGGGGGNSSCNVARRASNSAGGTLFVSLAWALLPIPAAALVRRRARKKPAPKAKEEVVQ